MGHKHLSQNVTVRSQYQALLLTLGYNYFMIFPPVVPLEEDFLGFFGHLHFLKVLKYNKYKVHVFLISVGPKCSTVRTMFPKYLPRPQNWKKSKNQGE